MKKIAALFLTVIVVTGVVSANSLDNPKSATGTAVMRNGSTFKLFYKGEKTNTVKVTIQNEEGKVLFAEVIKNIDSFMRPYNFSSLPEGEYSIEVIDDNGKHVEKVDYSSKRAERFINLMKVSGADTKYILSVANRGENQLNIRILDESSNELYASSEKISGDFAKVYNLESVKGSVVFEVTDQTGTVRKLTY